MKGFLCVSVCVAIALASRRLRALHPGGATEELGLKPRAPCWLPM